MTNAQIWLDDKPEIKVNAPTDSWRLIEEIYYNAHMTVAAQLFDRILSTKMLTILLALLLFLFKHQRQRA